MGAALGGADRLVFGGAGPLMALGSLTIFRHISFVTWAVSRPTLGVSVTTEEPAMITLSRSCRTVINSLVTSPTSPGVGWGCMGLMLRASREPIDDADDVARRRRCKASAARRTG